MPDSLSDKKQVEDEVESTLPCLANKSQKLQKVSRPITVHSSLAAISAMCDEVTAMDLQTDPTLLWKSQKVRRQQ